MRIKLVCGRVCARARTDVCAWGGAGWGCSVRVWRWGGGGSRVYDEDEAEDRPPHTHAPPPDEFRTTPCHRAAIHIYSLAWRGSAALYLLRAFPMQLDARSPSNPRWSKGHLRRCRCSAACGEGEGRRREEHLVPNGCARARACTQVRGCGGAFVRTARGCTETGAVPSCHCAGTERSLALAEGVTGDYLRLYPTGEDAREKWRECITCITMQHARRATCCST